MTYICTLLKDLPEYPAGTTFTAKKVPRIGESKSRAKFSYLCKFDGDVYGRRVFSDSVMDNPVWVRKKIDENCLTELKCKFCDSTKMELSFVDIPCTHYGDIVYFRKKIVGTCACGQENELVSEFVTHSEIMVRTKMG